MSVSNIIYKIQTIANQGKVYICGCLRTTKRGDLISSSPSNVDGISGLMCTVNQKEPLTQFVSPMVQVRTKQSLMKKLFFNVLSWWVC